MQCRVCGDGLAPGRPTEAEPVCPAVGCRMVLARRAQLAPPAFQRYLEQQQRLARERKAAAQASARASQALAEAEAAEEALLWRGHSVEAYPPSHFARLVLPSGPDRDTRLSAARRRRYAEHLRQIIAQAQARPATVPAQAEDRAPDEPWSGRLCAQCGGGCCTRGGDTAYLSVDTIRRVLDRRPGWSAGLLMVAYLEALGEHSRRGSCINHGAEGCRLPRELRADICNAFACPALTELQDRARRRPALQGVIVIQRRQDHWRRGMPGLDNGIVGQVLLKPAGGGAAAAE